MQKTLTYLIVFGIAKAVIPRVELGDLSTHQQPVPGLAL